MHQVSRDSFGRFSIMREVIRHEGQEKCAWCGNPGRPSTTGKGFRLYRYHVQHDGGLFNKGSKVFCNIECHEAFTGFKRR